MRMTKRKMKGKMGFANGMAKLGTVDRGNSRVAGKAKLGSIKNTQDRIKAVANKAFM